MTYIFHRPNKKHNAFGSIEYEQSKESGPLVYAHAVNKISKRLLRKYRQLFVHENPLNLGISVTLSGGRSVLQECCVDVTWSFDGASDNTGGDGDGVTLSAAPVRRSIGCSFRAISGSMLMQSSTRLAL